MSSPQSNSEPGYRPGLPELPNRMKRLPIDRGYPVPWFVVRLDDVTGRPVMKAGPLVVGERFDFRVADGHKRIMALRDDLCWVCGQKLGTNKVFVLGPMCIITRTTSEPPRHADCAHFSAVACPFLTQQTMDYREGNLPDGVQDAPGCPINRQPGVAALWCTRSFQLFDSENGEKLITVGEPKWVQWWSHGRTALRSEIHESIRTGYPKLFELAQAESLQSILQLNEQLVEALQFIS